MKIFVSTSGEMGLKIAKALKLWLENVLPAVDLWISDDELPGGKYWQTVLSEKLNDLHSCIAIITKESIYSPWIYFECGALSKATKDSVIYPYLFDVEVNDVKNTPLSQFQFRAANMEGTRKLVIDLNNNLQNNNKDDRSLQFIFTNTWHVLEKEFNAIREETVVANEFSENKNHFNNVLNQVAKIPVFKKNIYLKEVIIQSLKDLESDLQVFTATKNSFYLPYILYPAYLIKLLKNFKTLTKAIAIVDKDEMFWSEKEGLEILSETQKKSTRIFAFREKSHLRKYFATISNHALAYDVFLIDYDILTRIYNSKPYDFSIIGDINSSSLLALYNEEIPLIKKIKFTADTELISRHHDIFTQIRDASVGISKIITTKNDDDIVDLVFPPIPPRVSKPSLTILEQKQIEMSSYIHPHEYHKHEEKHAYYVDMANRMIEICQAHFDPVKSSSKLRVLEFGAGTGLFTKRLLLMKDIDLTAIEIDWACYHIFLENMMKVEGMKKSTFADAAYSPGESGDTSSLEGKAKLQDTFTSTTLNSTVHCINEDCRTYNPHGKFDIIFSSFADHHIKTYDKDKYFRNIRDNLKTGGIVIVGDEFLPDYQEDNPGARETALRRYHNHIIEETKRNHGDAAWGLIQLEETALESGLKSIGDFKLSCTLYEKFVADAGFIYRKELIGPPEEKGVGGVYVYILSLPASIKH